MAYISLPFGFVRKEKKVKLDLPKNYRASQRLPYVRNEDPNFKNSIIGIVGNNRSDLRTFLLATSDYGKKYSGKY